MKDFFGKPERTLGLGGFLGMLVGKLTEGVSFWESLIGGLVVGFMLWIIYKLAR